MCKKESPWLVFLSYAYPKIVDDCLMVVNSSGRRYVTYSDEEMCQMTRCEGYPTGVDFRTHESGYEAIRGHREELWDTPLELWWTRDGVPGIAFTKDPQLGTRWYVVYSANLTRITALRGADSARIGQTLRPSMAGWFKMLEGALRELGSQAGNILTKTAEGATLTGEALRLEEWANGTPKTPEPKPRKKPPKPKDAK